MSPVLFYTIGYPGAGKTTLASKLSYWLGIEHLRGDTIGLELFRFPTFSLHERQVVYGEMECRAAQALQTGSHVLYDAAVNTCAQRLRLVELATSCNARAIGLWVEVSTPLAKQRAATVRDRGIVGNVARVIPSHIFDQYVANFEAPGAAEYTVRIAGDCSFPLQYRRLQGRLDRSGTRLPHLVQ